MNPRAFVVSRAESGQTVAAVLRARLALSWSAVRRLIDAGWVRVGHSVCRDAGRRLKPGQQLFVQLPADRAKPVGEPHRAKSNVHEPKNQGFVPVIRYTDAQVVVVEKPAGLTTMRHAYEAAEFTSRPRRY